MPVRTCVIIHYLMAYEIVTRANIFCIYKLREPRWLVLHTIKLEDRGSTQKKKQMHLQVLCIKAALHEPLGAKYSYTRYKFDILFHINKRFLGSTYGYPHSSKDKQVIHIISKRC